MKLPVVKPIEDRAGVLNLSDYGRFAKVKQLFDLIRQYDAFPNTPVTFDRNGQVDVTKRYKQGDIKVDWPNSWQDIIDLINQLRDTLYDIIGYYKNAVRHEGLVAGEAELYPGDSYRYGDPYDDVLRNAYNWFPEFYSYRKQLEKWSELGMARYVGTNQTEIEEQVDAIQVQMLRGKKVSDMTGDDVFQILAYYDKYKDSK